MMTFKNLPLYRIVVDPDDPESGMTCISMVDSPAIQTDFLCFEKEEKMAFAVQDADKHIVTGPAIIANMPIYRYSPQMNEYYVVFDEETIDNIILKYSKLGLWNEVSLQHDGHNINSAIMIEFYKKDSKTGIVPKEYEDVADGSLFVSYKITDEDLWNQIKNGDDIKGFSIEITADLEATDEQIDDGQEEDDDWFDELMDLLEELGLEVLFKDEKKKFANEDIKKVLEDAADKGLKVEIDIEGKTVKGYTYSLLDYDGSTSVALWDGQEWNIVNLKDIKAVQTTTAKATSDIWAKALTNPGYEWVEKKLDDSSNVNPSANKDIIEDSILNGKWVIINYDDEQPNPKTGARQCVVMERGWTPGRNNRAVRVWEQFGDSRHPESISGWRTMIIHRITSIRLVDYLDPITVAPQGFRPRGAGQDADGFVCDLRSPLT